MSLSAGKAEEMKEFSAGRTYNADKTGKECTQNFGLGTSRKVTTCKMVKHAG
jgi:hypothetical protein